ncbi:hypothetical protein GCM10009836_12440 [Pseudonocardia ailaonensis]|uniref:Serine aminopeptidase S33 domain-containing protein n=1 Tax=Pseudonocardia ailaonensis TaxID=367279 RepID=A0ABN2MSF0_9PSEU
MTTATTELVAAWAEPEGVVPRGTLLVVPGRGEHPAVYARFGRRISADGYRVLVVDDPTTDPGATTGRIRELLGDTGSGPHPRVLVGSDTGALFAAGLVASGAVEVDALVLAALPIAAPTVEVDWGSELEARTACPVHQALLDGDPSVRRGTLAEAVPPGWPTAADPARITVPVLGLHGLADTVAPVAAARDWYGRLAEVELVGIVGGRHDALNDQSHRTAAATVVRFLERLRSGLPEIARLDLVRRGGRVIGTVSR